MRILRVFNLPEQVHGLIDLFLPQLLDKEVSLHILDSASLVLKAILILQEEAGVDEVADSSLGHLGAMLLLVFFFFDGLESSNVALEIFQRRCR